MSHPYNLQDDSVVVVIGSGAGGGTLANELAQKGIDVVCLEAGGRLELSDIANDPPAMDQKMGWHDRREGNPVWLCKTVGGTTMRWAAVALRFKEYEFRARSVYGDIPGTSLIDWPLTFEELVPYYDKAENKMGVSGTHGIPPSFETNNYKVMKAGGQRLGYREMTSARMAINPQARDGRPGCQQIGFCFSGCAIGAKWSTLYTEIPKAEATGHFELRPHSMVVRINHDAAGRVTGVTYRDKQGELKEQKARAVAVAGNVVETTRLLLNSSSARFPDGLGNSTGHVGRNYMKHLHSFLCAEMPGPVWAFKGARQTGLILDEWRQDSSRGFVGGYSLQAAFGTPALLANSFSPWGVEMASLMENYDHIAFAFVCGEDLPEPANRITLHESETDQNGLPVPVLVYRDHENNKAMERHSLGVAARIYETLDSRRHLQTNGNVSACHNMGVARMSTNPEDGVTNRWGQVHDTPNLFVSDGSVFPTSGSANPTLTIVALAIRQADHIASRMSRKEL